MLFTLVLFVAALVHGVDDAQIQNLRKSINGPKTSQPLNVVVDVSHWQSDITFSSIKANGIMGLIHKCTQGTGYADSMYSIRVKEAQETGLLFGAYHFGTGDSGEEQAKYFLEKSQRTSETLLVLDWESHSDSQMTLDIAKDFVQYIHSSTGTWPTLYSGHWVRTYGNDPILTNCPLWIASYEDEPDMPEGWSDWTLWQYTDGNSGSTPHSVEGIGNCDRDKFNGDEAALKSFWHS